MTQKGEKKRSAKTLKIKHKSKGFKAKLQNKIFASAKKIKTTHFKDILGMSSIFSRIVSGEIPCYKVAEDEKHFAFLDIRPLKKGHTLVIPKAETDYIFDLTPQALGELHIFSQKVAKAVGEAVPCLRVGVVVLGLEVPHAHIHLVPLTSESDVIFNQPRPNISKEEMQATAKEIAEKFLLQ